MGVSQLRMTKLEAVQLHNGNKSVTNDQIGGCVRLYTLSFLACIAHLFNASAETIITPDRWQSKTSILSTNVDQISLETEF